MSKRFLVPLFLWVLVLVVSGSYFFLRPFKPETDSVRLELEEENRIRTTKDGRAIASTPWKHLSDVDRFVLTNHEGEIVDSADLHGTPYVVSFFFSSCPSFCRDLNKQIRQSNDSVRGQDIRFFTVTVDPDVDTVPVLKKYADSFDAKAQRWGFLTGSMDDLKKLGENSFNVVVDRDTHTDDILLVDKWGRYRDRFKWSSAEDMKRFKQVVEEVCAETEPPMGKVIETRNVMAGIDPPELNAIPWLQDFHAKSDKGLPFFSRELTGQVWIAHFGGGRAAGLKTMAQLTEAAEKIEDALKVVSIHEERDGQVTTFTMGDSSQFGMTLELLASPSEAYGRILKEYFGIAPEAAARTLAIVDRFGGVRESIEVSDEISADALAKKIEAAVKRYSAESKPVIQ